MILFISNHFVNYLEIGYFSLTQIRFEDLSKFKRRVEDNRNDYRKQSLHVSWTTKKHGIN